MFQTFWWSNLHLTVKCKNLQILGRGNSYKISLNAVIYEAYKVFNAHKSLPATLGQDVSERSRLCKAQYNIFNVNIELLNQVKSFKVDSDW